MAEEANHPTWPTIEGIISDLDGVVYRGQTPIPDAIKAFQKWQLDGVPICFVTNNSTYTAEDVVQKLGRFGLAIKPENVVTSAITTAQLIRRNNPAGTRVYVIGAASLTKALIDANLEITHQNPTVVVVGLDREITYEKLRIAVGAILKGAVLIGTNPDLLLPTADGFEPGAGAILTAIAAATGMTPLIVGKPEAHMIEAALTRLRTARSSTLMIGDQIATDIRAGKSAGVCTVLVTTGVPFKENAAQISPDFTVATLLDIPVTHGDCGCGSSPNTR